MELGQLIEYNKKNIFLEKLWKKGAGRLDHFLFSKKSLKWGKRNRSAA